MVLKMILKCVSKCREMQFRVERLKTQRVFRSGKDTENALQAFQKHTLKVTHVYPAVTVTSMLALTPLLATT